MANADHSEDDEVKEFNTRLAAATTREEKLAVLRQYMDEDYAQFSLDWAMGENLEKYERHRPINHSYTYTPEDLAEKAPTREGKLAVLCEHYPEEEAQESLRLMELQPHIDALPTRAEKLAILRAHFPEATVQAVIGSFMQRQAEKEPPLSATEAAYVEEWHKVVELEHFRELLARLCTIPEQEARNAVLRQYMSEEAIQYMNRSTMGKGKRDVTSPGLG